METPRFRFAAKKKTSFVKNVVEAATYYRAKFGAVPNLCTIPRQLADAPTSVGVVKVRAGFGPLINLKRGYYEFDLEVTSK